VCFLLLVWFLLVTIIGVERDLSADVYKPWLVWNVRHCVSKCKLNKNEPPLGVLAYDPRTGVTVDYFMTIRSSRVIAVKVTGRPGSPSLLVC